MFEWPTTVSATPHSVTPSHPLFAVTLARSRGHWHVAFAFELTVLSGTWAPDKMVRANLGSLQFGPECPVLIAIGQDL